MVIRCACACVCGVSVVGARTASRWWEAGCSVAACPGAGRARRRPSTTPTMRCEMAARNCYTMIMVSFFFYTTLMSISGIASKSILLSSGFHQAKFNIIFYRKICPRMQYINIRELIHMTVKTLKFMKYSAK